MVTKGELMDYETEKELIELMRGIADDFLELKAIIDALIEIGESDVTSCIVLEIARDLTRKTFHQTGNCRTLLELF